MKILFLLCCCTIVLSACNQQSGEANSSEPLPRENMPSENMSKETKTLKAKPTEGLPTKHSNAEAAYKLTQLTYKTTPQASLGLNLYQPNTQQGAAPLLIWVHGGAWMRGSKEDFMQKNRHLAQSLLAKGYAIAALSYRLSHQAVFPAQVQDINDAINYLVNQRASLKLNTDHIVMMGRSAGAHLAALIANTFNKPESGFYEKAQPANYQVVGTVNFFGPSDLEELRGNSGKVDHDAPDAAEAKLLGVSPRERPDLARWASPTTYVGANTPPMILFHGSSDEVVPASQSQHFKNVLDKAGVANQLYLAEGARHGDKIFDSDIYVKKAVAFIDDIVN